MKTASVKIGPSFFCKEFNDYSDWRWAYVREAAQNGIDAPGSTKLYFEITLTADGDTRVVFGNNGAPMDEDTLANKLLALGESGKNFAGTVGGFGKAKLLLLFAQRSWVVRTGTLLASGEGGNYELTDNLEYLHGTRTEVVMKGNQLVAIVDRVRLFAEMSQWSGEIGFIGKDSDGPDAKDQFIPIEGRTKKGSRRKELPWGVIYTNNSGQGLLLVRINGTPMFTKPVQYKGMVLIELSGNSADTLTANRDGLRWEQQRELDEFLSAISTNARKALREPRAVERKTYSGYKLAGRAMQQVAGRDEAEIGQGKDLVLFTRIVANTERAGAADAPALTVAQVERVFRPEFRVRNELVGTIPAWFLPEGFSDNSKRLISNWIALLVELASLAGCDKPFAVGFCFDDEARGLYERDGGTNVIYVNPLSVVEKPGKPRQLKVYWRFDARGNWELLSLAVHEFCHHWTGEDHTEVYANKLTDLFAMVLANRTRFSRHFSAPICWPE
jgi:hypothetical protein